MLEHVAKTRAELTDRILADAPRLTDDDSFCFACHPGVSCFGDCCGDVNIVLTPYDVLRLKSRLGISSAEFLATRAVVPFGKDQRLPMPLLRMKEEEGKPCPFVQDGACTVYEDRPWACRMFPIGYAAPGAGNPEGREFYFLVEEECCRGFEEDRKISVREWKESQGVAEYDAWGERYKRLAVDEILAKERILDPKRMQMFFLATYDLDTFRRFVLESTFLDRFEVDPDLVHRIESDDEELLAFGLRWLEFSLLGKPTMTLSESAVREQAP